MTVREYQKFLNNLISNNSDVLDMEMVYSVDDEGSEYKPVLFGPEVGHLNNDKMFIGKDETTDELNIVCIN